jgi:hypothetical protein
MVKYFVSKNGYFYKMINDKKIRISRDEYVKKNKNIKGGAPKGKGKQKENLSVFELQNMPQQNMQPQNIPSPNHKNKITVIFVGGAELTKNNGSRNNKTGQIPNLSDYIRINPENTLIAVDRDHGNNEIPHLTARSGIKVSTMTNPNDIKQNCLNVSYMESSPFFERFNPDLSSYYVILAFYGGIDKEMPSFEVAKSIGIENPFFYDIRNALCLGMSCFNIPPNITEFLTNYGFQLNPVLIPEIDESLQNAFYAIRYDLRALYKVIKGQNNVSRTEEQINDILELLKYISINTVEEACSYYEHLKQTYGTSNGKPKDVNEGIFKDFIEQKYNQMGLLPFFKERNN